MDKILVSDKYVVDRSRFEACGYDHKRPLCCGQAFCSIRGNMVCQRFRCVVEFLLQGQDMF